MPQMVELKKLVGRKVRITYAESESRPPETKQILKAKSEDGVVVFTMTDYSYVTFATPKNTAGP